MIEEQKEYEQEVDEVTDRFMVGSFSINERSQSSWGVVVAYCQLGGCDKEVEFKSKKEAIEEAKRLTEKGMYPTEGRACPACLADYYGV